MRAPTMVPQGELIPKEDESYNHAARTCRVGPDNKLYITLGQRLWRDQGKVQQACELLAPVLRMVH